jgi:hypothetical protein
LYDATGELAACAAIWSTIEPAGDAAAAVTAATRAAGLAADRFAGGRGFLAFDLAEAFAIPSTPQFFILGCTLYGNIQQ